MIPIMGFLLDILITLMMVESVITVDTWIISIVLTFVALAVWDTKK